MGPRVDRAPHPAPAGGRDLHGGEDTNANPLAIEAAPKRWRGMVAGLIQSAHPIAYIAISLSVLVADPPRHAHPLRPRP
ncbi:MAG TPA: hypothetical protein VKY90_19595 [Candidatus Dormibacteraeota bacterium]|nr:hypothetical protein [Candidatus Dormibacteraeota bacterium]